MSQILKLDQIKEANWTDADESRRGIAESFIAAVIETFGVQAQIPCRLSDGTSTSLQPDFTEKNEVIMGVIGIVSSQVKGHAALVFQEDVFLKVYQCMFGETSTRITAEMQDAVSELLNIVYGCVKSEMNNERGFDLRPAIPWLLIGGPVSILPRRRGGQMTVLPFASAIGNFHVELSFDPMP